jgi:hypothetical protein
VLTGAALSVPPTTHFHVRGRRVVSAKHAHMHFRLQTKSSYVLRPHERTEGEIGIKRLR